MHISSLWTIYGRDWRLSRGRKGLLHLVPIDRWHGFQWGLSYLSCPLQLGDREKEGIWEKLCLENQCKTNRSKKQRQKQKKKKKQCKTNSGSSIQDSPPTCCPSVSHFAQGSLLTGNTDLSSHGNWWTVPLWRNSDKVFFSKTPKSVWHSSSLDIMYALRKVNLADLFKLRTPGLESMSLWAPDSSWLCP